MTRRDARSPEPLDSLGASLCSKAFATRDSNRSVLASLLSFTVSQTLAAVSASHSDFAFDGVINCDRSDRGRVWINVGVARARILDGRSVHVE